MGLSHAMPRNLAGGVMWAPDLRLKAQNKYPVLLPIAELIIINQVNQRSYLALNLDHIE